MNKRKMGRKIKFVDLVKENLIVKDKVLKKIGELVDSSKFTLGNAVNRFEKNFASYCGANYGLGVASGTDSIRVALKACDVGKGDEIITTPISYTSTSLAISHAGANPVFVDVKDDGNIDPLKIRGAITKKTKALLITHMYGNPCDLAELKKIAKKYEIYLIDDCSHAHGANYGGKKVGGICDVSCFSNYPTKCLGAWGDAGTLTTSSKKIYEKALLYKNYGEKIRNFSKVIGYNSKLDTIQAIVLNHKLKYLEKWNRKRQDAAKYYSKGLNNVGDIFVLPFSRDISYYVFPIKSKFRDKLSKHLSSNGVENFIHYPMPIHLQECFSFLGYKRGDFPRAEEHSSKVLSIPLYPSISRSDQDYVINIIKDFFG